MIYVELPHPATLAEEALLAQCELGRGRSGGPGGQHRNRVQTEATLTHSATGVSATAGERRSAEENRRVALRRLRVQLAVRVRAFWPYTKAGRSELWTSRVRDERIACSVRHDDFPAMLAEALDAVWASGLDQRRAALRLECSPTQLVRFVAEEPEALAAWNDARGRKGLRVLRA